MRRGATPSRSGGETAPSSTGAALLQATALGLCSVVVGAFDDDAAARLLELDGSETPLCLLPVGRPA